MIHNLTECLHAIAYQGQLKKALELMESELPEPHLHRASAAVRYRIERIAEEILDYTLREVPRAVGTYRLPELTNVFFSIPAGELSPGLTLPSSNQILPFGWTPMKRNQHAA